MTAEDEKNKELEKKWIAEWAEITETAAWNRFIAFLLGKQRYLNGFLLNEANPRDKDMFLKGQISGIDMAIKARPESIFTIKKKPKTGEPKKAP